MKSKLILAAFLATFALRATAGTINFENMPDSYLYYGGQQNFGNYWAGVNFGPDSTILDSVRFGYNSSGYPAHSGTSVLFSIGTPYIDMTLDTAVNDVSFWYSAGQAFDVFAYDASNNLISSYTLSQNSGSSSFFDVSSSSSNISRIRWSGTGNYFTIDDVSADFVSGKPRNVSDSASTLSLFGLGLICLGAFRRRFVR